MFSTTKQTLEAFDNQHDFERMCADILNASGYRDVVLVAPRGGSDGGKDITFSFGNDQKGLACVTLRKDIDKKFDEDFSQRQAGEYDKYYLFCNVYLTSSQKSKYKKYCDDKLQAELIPQDVEALRSILDSKLENIRGEYLGISQNDREKEALILDMASDSSNIIAREAVRKLRARGWLQDGTLEGANLSKAKLQNVDLSDANLKGVDISNANLQNANLTNANLESSNIRDTNLRGAMLQGANLENADLTEAILTDVQGLSDDQLAKVSTLVGATMASGKRYNGRFNLKYDIGIAHLMRTTMTQYYGVSVENYEWGQEWYQLSQSPPIMFDPNLEKWYRLNEYPEGICENPNP